MINSSKKGDYLVVVMVWMKRPVMLSGLEFTQYCCEGVSCKEEDKSGWVMDMSGGGLCVIWCSDERKIVDKQ